MTNDIVWKRPLGDNENFFRCRNAVGFYQNFAAVSTFSLDLSKQDRLVYCALRKSILDYHILACNVFRDETTRKSELRPIKRATFGDVYWKEAPPTGKEWYEQFIHRLCCDKLFNLYEESPLFCVILAGERTVGASFEHTPADGVVAPQFLAIFLDNLGYCEDPANQSEYESLYGVAPAEISPETVIFDADVDMQYVRHSLPPPVEMIMDAKHLDYTYGDSDHYSTKAPEHYPQKWPGRFPATMDAKKVMKLVHVGPENFRKLLATCKKNGVTFTAYLACIQALSFNPVYGDKHHTSAMIAVTLRRFLTADAVDEPYRQIVTKENYKMLGNFAHMGLANLFEPVKEFSWELVRKVSNELQQTVKNTRLLNTQKAFSDAADEYDENEVLFSSVLGANKADAIKISNVGAYNFPVYKSNNEELTIDDIMFSQDMAPGASEFVLNVVSCPRGGLNIVLTYFDGDENLESLHGDLEHNLQKYVDAI
ncbi:hypothetical protein FT663_00080 [Candidozyma haemuli var. vulneris]|uniref:Alcohol acetyltransferase n=1 Tax=Candidozyma haemuli TaxID=45357 RepID=A0A2V1AVQ8_9ASCO|nr:hypothetical protein CXQ85_000869 [[Candida] haemuloni]KAF3994060.1 hypothetical protein FT662_00246 [[Candida] haemuloni var. vulneris]KAF3995857.1 hypothetical protein FT663_00080 [[Candida] haemuloni var. vulneris]PVH21874.1 hypothetical protein CXQ85_000869 [[Candida] haemuloni]